MKSTRKGRRARTVRNAPPRGAKVQLAEASGRVVDVVEADVTEDIPVPIERKGIRASTTISDGQHVEVTISQAFPDADRDLTSARAFVKWVERDPDTKVDFLVNIAEHDDLLLMRVYASDVLAIARAIESAVYAAKRAGLLKIGEAERVTVRGVDLPAPTSSPRADG